MSIFVYYRENFANSGIMPLKFKTPLKAEERADLGDNPDEQNGKLDSSL
jgi:hypothetical protein